MELVWREEEDLLMCLSGEERPLLYRHKRWMRTVAKIRHRLGSFPQPAARRVVTRRGEAGGGGGARVDVPLVLMLIQVGKEPPL